MRITTAKQARQFIGEVVIYAKHSRVKMLRVCGKSILIDSLGENIWLWLPDVILESIEAPLPTQQP